MQFAIKKEESIPEIKYGHRIKVKRYAWLPVVIGDKRVWLEYFFATIEWRKGAGHRTYNGLFVQSYADAWVVVAKEIIHKKRKPKKYWSVYRGKISESDKVRLNESLQGIQWTFRPVIQVRMKNAFYKKGDILKIKHFATFGCYDHRDRWVDYWDIGHEIPKPENWKD